MKSIKKFFLVASSIAGIFSLEAQGQRVASPIPGVGDALPLSLLEEEEMDAPASGTTTIPEVGNVRSFQFRAPNQAAGAVSQQIGGGAAATVLPFLPRGVQPIPAQSRRPTIQPQVTSQVRALQSQERPQVQQVGQTQARAQVQTPQPPVKQQVQTPRVQTRQQIQAPQTQIRPQIRATQGSRNFSSLREYIGSQVPVQRVTRTVGRSGAEESKVVEERGNPIPFVTASKPVQVVSSQPSQRSVSEERIPETQRATPDVEESFYREQRGQPHHSSVPVVQTGHDRQAEQQQHEASAAALQQVGGHGGAGQIPQREEEQEQQQEQQHAGTAAAQQQPQQDLAARRRAALLEVGRNFRAQKQAAAAAHQQQPPQVAAVHGGVLPLGAQQQQQQQQVVAAQQLQQDLAARRRAALLAVGRNFRAQQQQQQQAAAAAAQQQVPLPQQPQQQQQQVVAAQQLQQDLAARRRAALLAVGRNFRAQQQQQQQAAAAAAQQQVPLPQQPQQQQQQVAAAADDDMFGGLFDAPPVAAQPQQPQPQQQQQQVAAAHQQQPPQVAAVHGGVLPLGAQQQQQRDAAAAGGVLPFGVAQPQQQPVRDLDDVLGLRQQAAGGHVDLQAMQDMEDDLFGRRPQQQLQLPQPQHPVDFADWFADMGGAQQPPQQQVQQQRHQPVDLLADLFAAGGQQPQPQQQHQQQQQAAAAAAVAAAQPQPARVFGGVNSIQREVQEEVRRNVDQFRRATVTVREQQQLDKERQQLIGQIQDLSTHETVQQAQLKYNGEHAKLSLVERLRFTASREGHHPTQNQFAPVYAAFMALKKAKEEAADLQQANASRTHIEDELRQRSREFQQAQIQAHDSSNQLSAKTGEVLRHFDPAEASKILRRAEAQLAFPAAVALGLHRDGAPAQGFQRWEETLREKVEAKIQADQVAGKTDDKNQARNGIVKHLEPSPVFQSLAGEIYPGVDVNSLSYAQKGALIKAYLGVTGRKANDPRGETWDDARYIAGQILPGGVTSWDEAVGNIRSCHDQEEMHRQQAAAAAADDDFDCP